MSAHRGHTSHSRIGAWSLAVALSLLWIMGCVPARTPTALPTAPVWTGPTWISHPTPTESPPLEPASSPTLLALPTIDLNAPTATPGPGYTQRAPSPTMDPKTALHVWTAWDLGPSERQTSRVKAIYYDRYQPGDIVFEWWLYNYDNPESLRSGAHTDACTLLWAIAIGPTKFTSIVLHGYLTTPQRPGSIDPGFLVVSLVYHGITAERIDSQYYGAGFSCPSNLYDFADHSSIAPGFR